MFRDYYYQNFSPSKLSTQTGLYPYWSGNLKAAENYHCNSRVLDDYFIIHVKTGRGLFISTAERFRLSPNDYFFLFPGILHSYYTSKDNLLELSWIGFNGFMSNEILHNLQIRPDNPVLRLSEGKDNKCSELMDRLIHEPATSSSLVLSGMLFQLFGSLLESSRYAEKNISERSQSSRSGKILRALSYIDQNYTAEISVTTLSEYVSMSRSAFSRLFKKETGHSPQDYIIELRLTQAEHLLSGNMPVKDVAGASGFNDTCYFSRCFKKKYDLSPRDFRRLKKDSPEIRKPAGDRSWL